jgi:hypothetical protein
MVEATGTTYRKIANVGTDMLCEIYASAVSSGQTLTIPTANTEVTTSSVIKIISVNNTTKGRSQGYASTGPAEYLYASYTAATRLFTIVESGITSDAFRIEFRIVPPTSA